MLSRKYMHSAVTSYVIITPVLERLALPYELTTILFFPKSIRDSEELAVDEPSKGMNILQKPLHSKPLT